MRAILTMLSIAVIAAPAAGQDRAADEAAVLAHIMAAVDAINRRDVAGWAALFTRDADVIILTEPRVEGRAAIQALAATNWAGARNERAVLLPSPRHARVQTAAARPQL